MQVPYQTNQSPTAGKAYNYTTISYEDGSRMCYGYNAPSEGDPGEIIYIKDSKLNTIGKTMQHIILVKMVRMLNMKIKTIGNPLIHVILDHIVISMHVLRYLERVTLLGVLLSSILLMLHMQKN